MTHQTQLPTREPRAATVSAPYVSISRDRSRFLQGREGGVQSSLRLRLVGGLVGRR